MKTPQVIQKEKYIKLISDFLNKKYSRAQILKELQWSSRKLTMFCYRHKLGKIPNNINISITKEQEQIIIGSLLGDGCISGSGKFSKFCRLQISHCAKQLKYLEYKYSFIKNLCKSGIKIRNRYDIRFNEKNYTQYEIKTKSIDIFLEYRKNWYKNNKKDVYKPDVLKLNRLGIAIWFMDDGTNEKSSFSLATMSFSKNSVLFLQSILLTKFNISTTIRKDNTIYIRKKSRMDFINLIKPYLINSMEYKIRPDKLGEFRETPEVDNPEPS